MDPPVSASLALDLQFAFYWVLGINLKPSCLLFQHFTNWTVTPAPRLILIIKYCHLFESLGKLTAMIFQLQSVMTMTEY